MSKKLDMTNEMKAALRKLNVSEEAIAELAEKELSLDELETVARGTGETFKYTVTVMGYTINDEASLNFVVYTLCANIESCMGGDTLRGCLSNSDDKNLVEVYDRRGLDGLYNYTRLCSKISNIFAHICFFSALHSLAVR